MRDASFEDAAAITAIYNAARIGGVSFDNDAATVEETLEELQAHIGRFPAVVVQHGADVVAFASTSPYRRHPCYDGVADFAVYVSPAAQRRGAGRLALATLLERAVAAGLRKFVSRIVVDNVASRTLCARLGFREVGVYERHGRIDGGWKDCVIVERLLDSGAR